MAGRRKDAKRAGTSRKRSEVVRRYRIVHKNTEIGVVPATSDYTALVRIAGDLGLDPTTITGTYRLPVPDDSPIYATEVNR
jgi:hypothetical protein